MDLQIVFGTLVLALVLFVWGKFRHDVVAVFCLLIITITGIIPVEDAFLGFSHRNFGSERRITELRID